MERSGVGANRWPTRPHKPRPKGYRLTPDNQAIVCAPCNKTKGSLSLQRIANRLVQVGDPQAKHVVALIVRRATMPESRVINSNRR